jgi:hypothetical protein
MKEIISLLIQNKADIYTLKKNLSYIAYSSIKMVLGILMTQILTLVDKLSPHNLVIAPNKFHSVLQNTILIPYK